MPTDVLTDELSPEVASRDPETRLRMVEDSLMMLLGYVVMSLQKRKLDKEELVSDLSDLAAGIGFSISNRPPPE